MDRWAQKESHTYFTTKIEDFGPPGHHDLPASQPWSTLGIGGSAQKTKAMHYCPYASRPISIVQGTATTNPPSTICTPKNKPFYQEIGREQYPAVLETCLPECSSQQERNNAEAPEHDIAFLYTWKPRQNTRLLGNTCKSRRKRSRIAESKRVIKNRAKDSTIDSS